MTSLRIFACDIDGTLLNHGRATRGLLGLQRRLQREPPGLRLVYATGRTFRSTQTLVRLGLLPPPDAIAAQVGTELWLPPWRRSHDGYAAHLAPSWNDQAVRSLIEVIPELELQDSRYQTSWKISAHLRPRAAKQVITTLRKRLADRALGARVIYSGRRYLDVIPARAGKRAALQFLALHWRLDEATDILVCGDSGNDLDMLSAPETAGVVVGNADDPRLAALDEHDHVYVAEQPYAAGVLEGAEAFDFWAE